MVNGTEAFRNIALVINRTHEGFYTPTDINLVEVIIENHDNPGIGLPFSLETTKDIGTLYSLFIHRESDRLWMLDEAGFSLDLLRRVIENGKFEPENYLGEVISKHIKEGIKYGNSLDRSGINLKRYVIGAESYPTLYVSNTGFGIFLRLINQACLDYGLDRNKVDENTKAYLK